MRPSAVLRKFATKIAGLFIALVLIAGTALAAAAVQVVYVPGTGGTSANPPDTTDISWLDNGAYKGLPVDGVTDSDEYPATLGHGGTNSDGSHIATGPESKDMGVTATIKHVERYDKDKTVIVMPCGSQGAMVCQEAAAKLVQEGYPADHLFVIEYSNPYTKGTGFIDRFNPDQEAGLPVVWMTGFKGGAPSNPADPRILQINHGYDPMSNSPRYLWTLLWTLPNAILGFVFEHGALMDIDYADPQNKVTTVDNVTTVTLHTNTIPLLMPLVLVAAAMGIPPAVSQSLLKPFDDVMRPIVDMGGQNDPGKFTLFPSPQTFATQLVHVAAGFANAIVDTAKLATGQPVLSTAKQVGPTPTEQLINDAKAKDAELNGTSTAGTPSSTAAIAPTTALTPLAATPEAKVSQSAQDSSPTASTLKSSTATQPQAPQTSSDKPVADNKGDSDAPASTPSTSPSKDQKQDSPRGDKQDPKNGSDAPKVKAPKKGKHPKGGTDSDGDKPKSGSTTPKPEAKKGDSDSGSGPKPSGDDSSAKPQNHSSHKDSDSSGSKASAHAGGGESHGNS